MNTEILEQQADQIEDFLHSRRLPSRVTGGNVMPRWIQFLLQPAPGISAKAIEHTARDLAQALNARSVNMTCRNGQVNINVPRADPQPVNLEKVMARIPAERVPLGTAALGLADDGAPLLIRFPSPEVQHAIILADEEAARSLLHTIAMSLAAWFPLRSVQLCGFDVIGPNTTGPLDLERHLRDRQRDGVRLPLIIVARRLEEVPANVIRTGAANGFHIMAHSTDRKAIAAQQFRVVLRQREDGDFDAEMDGGVIRFTPAEGDAPRVAVPVRVEQPRVIINPHR